MFTDELPRPSASISLQERVHRLREHPKISAGAAIIAATMLGLVWHQTNTQSSGSSSAAPSSATAANTQARSATSGQTPNGASPGTTANGSSANNPAGNRSSDGSAESTTGGGATTSQTKVIVHVAGAVISPGLLTLPSTTRVGGAIDAAGGIRPDADMERINLASPIVDGTRIYVPVQGQPVPITEGTPAPAAATATGATGAPAGGSVSGAGSTGGLVNLNTATQAELETLPGIGPSMATAILEQRSSVGRFTSIEELKSVRGIGEKRFADLANKVTI